MAASYHAVKTKVRSKHTVNTRPSQPQMRTSAQRQPLHRHDAGHPDSTRGLRGKSPIQTQQPVHALVVVFVEVGLET